MEVMSASFKMHNVLHLFVARQTNGAHVIVFLLLDLHMIALVRRSYDNRLVRLVLTIIVLYRQLCVGRRVR